MLGVYLSLNGETYANNSLVKITEILNSDTMSNDNGALQCITDRMPCCASRQYRLGEWYFPDQSRVPIENHALTFYRNRGDDGSVKLNRLNNNIMAPLGQFCCEVLDATNASQRLYVKIGELRHSCIVNYTHTLHSSLLLYNFITCCIAIRKSYFLSSSECCYHLFWPKCCWCNYHS